MKLKPTTSNILIVLILATLVFIGGPIALIWAINTLFPVLAIPLTVETWLAAFIIPTALKANITYKGNKE